MVTKKRIDPTRDLPDTSNIESALQKKKGELENLVGELEKIRAAFKSSELFKKLEELEHIKISWPSGLSADQQREYDELLKNHDAEIRAQEAKLAQFETLLAKIQETILKIEARLTKLRADLKDAEKERDRLEQLKDELTHNQEAYGKATRSTGEAAQILNDFQLGSSLVQDLLDASVINDLQSLAPTMDTLHRDYATELARIEKELQKAIDDLEAMKKEIEALNRVIGELEPKVPIYQALEKNVQATKDSVSEKVAVATLQLPELNKVKEKLGENARKRKEIEIIFGELEKILKDIDWRKLDTRLLDELKTMMLNLSRTLLRSLQPFVREYQLDANGLPARLEGKIQMDLPLHAEDPDPKKTIQDYLTTLKLSETCEEVKSGVEVKVPGDKFKKMVAELNHLVGTAKLLEGQFGLQMERLLEKRGEKITPDSIGNVQKLKESNQDLLFTGLLESILMYARSDEKVSTLIQRIKSGTPIALKTFEASGAMRDFRLSRSAEGKYLIAEGGNSEELTEQHPLIRDIILPGTDASISQITSGKFDSAPLKIEIH